MAEKRKRGQNFTLEDKDKLVKLLLQYKDTILNKKTDGATNESKCRAWTELTNLFNSSGTVYRTKESLMKVWEKMKSESKIYYSSSRRNALQTGGGPSVIKIDPILEQVCSIMGRGCTGIVGINDSDADFMDVEKESMPKVICIGDSQASEIEIEEVDHRNSPVPKEPLVIKNVPEASDYAINRTPLWSRRRPQLSQNNERSEAIATLGASFKDINKKKEDVEDLKLQLCHMEIDFKRKLYELQLQAAAKEVEIKNEILLQVKDGSLALHNLFGTAPKKPE